MSEKSLVDIENGKVAVVVELQNNSEMRKRLMSIGLVEGTQVRPVYESTAGGIRAYMFRDSVFAIRYEDAKRIIVK